MSACNIIVDSCSYFRLAQSIQPLLKKAFGKEKHCLGVIEELDREYEKNPALKRKFKEHTGRQYLGRFHAIQIVRTLPDFNRLRRFETFARFCRKLECMETA